MREAAERFALPRMESQWRVSRLSQELDHGCVRDFTREDEIKLLRSALAADAEEKREIVAVLRECLLREREYDRIFGHPSVMADRLSALLAKLEGKVTT